MDIKYALLGFLSWKSATGYELKKMITETIGFEWSGNNNQIYTSLVQMHKDGLVTNEVQIQERYPARKVYTVTEAGKEALKNRLTDTIDPPQFRKNFLVQLAWADQLNDTELLEILDRYKSEIEIQLTMLQERMQRGVISPSRTQREKYLWNRISVNYLTSYHVELMWIQQTIEEITAGTYKESQ